MMTKSVMAIPFCNYGETRDGFMFHQHGEAYEHVVFKKAPILSQEVKTSIYFDGMVSKSFKINRGLGKGAP
jgi:hypothetical protein